jgi:hypothetical protein
MKSSVLVVGGSLVGLSVALATNRQGSHVTVLERSGGGTVSGGGLGLDVSLLQEVTGLSSAPPVYSGPDRDTTAWHLLREWVEVACSEEPSPLASCRPRAVSRAAGVAGRGTGVSSQYHHRRDRLPSRVGSAARVRNWAICAGRMAAGHCRREHGFGKVSKAASSDCNAAARPCLVTKNYEVDEKVDPPFECGVVRLASSTGPASAHASTWCL